jgi:hypothetical protein
MRQPLEIFPLTAEEVEALDTLYRSTKDVRVRTRAQIIPAFRRAAYEGSRDCKSGAHR